MYVSAGVLEVQTAAGSWVVSRDRAIWLPAGTWHEHRFYGDSRFHTVGFPVEHAPLRDEQPTMLAVSGLLRELVITCADPQLSAGEVTRIRAVIGDQLRRSPHQAISLPAPRDPRLADACAAAATQLERQRTLADLARQVGTSERTLSRLFRSELGMSYPQWHTNLRLRDAAVLLASGTTVTETAHRCGWQTTSGFIDAFRRAMGQTPGSYRARSPPRW